MNTTNLQRIADDLRSRSDINAEYIVNTIRNGKKSFVECLVVVTDEPTIVDEVIEFDINMLYSNAINKTVIIHEYTEKLYREAYEYLRMNVQDFQDCGDNMDTAMEHLGMSGRTATRLYLEGLLYGDRCYFSDTAKDLEIAFDDRGE